MGNYFLLQALTVIFALSIATTIFNKRILGFPQAIGVPIVSAIFVFILQWGASLLNGNEFVTINIHNIEAAVREIDFYDFLINGVLKRLNIFIEAMTARHQDGQGTHAVQPAAYLRHFGDVARRSGHTHAVKADGK